MELISSDIELLKYVLLIFGYVILIPMFNLILAQIPFKIKWFKSNKYKGRKSPIYKYHSGEYSGSRVYKYELKWSPLYVASSLNFNWVGLIPFSGLFSFYRYVEHDKSYGGVSLNSEKLEEYHGTLEKYWEVEYKQELVKKKERQEYISTEDKLNKEFNENYI